MSLVNVSLQNLINGVSQQASEMRLPSQCEEMINCDPSIVEFLKRRPATKHIAKLLTGNYTSAGIHVIDRDPSEQYCVLVTNDTIKVFDVQGNEKTVTYEVPLTYLAQGTPGTDFKFLTINDYTFILNRNIVTEMGTVRSPAKRYDRLVFVKQASYSTTYNIAINGVQVATHTTPSDDSGGTYKLSSTDIATNLLNQVRTAGYTANMAKSTIVIYSATDITVVATDSRSNTHITDIADKIQTFSDLPLVAQDGFIVEIMGDQSSSFDNYYVKFVADDMGNISNGIWEEVVEPGVLINLNPYTMPHQLVRNADGSFTYGLATWNERIAGDDKNYPPPSFVGKKINNLIFYSNRLGFLSEDSVILSAASEFFMFFISTATTLLDNDPIDVAVSHTKVNILRHAIAFDDALLLFSDTNQFVLTHDQSLSLESINIDPKGSYLCSADASPVSTGTNVMFAASRGSYGMVREYYYNEDTAKTEAPDISSHIPHYITGSINRLAINTNENLLIVGSTSPRNTVYNYKYYWNGNEKLQSAWGKWQFGGDILGFEFLSSKLYIVIQYDDGVYLEYMDVQPNYTDPDSIFEWCVDRKIFIPEDSTSVVYNDTNQQTTITMPYILPEINNDNLVVFVDFDSTKEKVNPGRNARIVEINNLLNIITVYGNFSDRKLIVGYKYSSYYEFSKQYMRVTSGSSKVVYTHGRAQMRQMRIEYDRTGYFNAYVQPEYRPINHYKFTGRILNEGGNILGVPAISTGSFKMPILSKSDKVKIWIESSEIVPFQFISADWDAFFNAQSRRVS